MKKLICVLSLVLGLTVAASAQDNGGLFRRGNQIDRGGSDDPNTPVLPGHGKTDNQPASAPLGGGALLLISFGAAYALSKKKD